MISDIENKYERLPPLKRSMLYDLINGNVSQETDETAKREEKAYQVDMDDNEGY